MLLVRFAAAMWVVGMIVLGVGVVSGQDYPNKPIRFLANESGGGQDVLVRMMIAEGLAASLGKPVIVDNRPAIIAQEIASKASPDGYTLTTGATNFWLGPLLQKMPFDPVKDFAPITLAVASPLIIVVPPSLPAKSVNELIAFAKAKPRALDYGMTSIGAITHLAPELFKQMAGVDIVRISYRGSGFVINALLGGEVHMMFATTGSALPPMKSGKLRGLAVTSAQPTALAPGLPTVASAGLPGYEATSLLGFFAPAKTPVPIINRLNQEMVRILNRADVKERLFNSGYEIIGSSPKEFSDKIKSEIVRMGKVIKDAGIRVE